MHANPERNPNWDYFAVYCSFKAALNTFTISFNPFNKKFCHQQDGLSFFGKRPDSTRIDATGGWHDAGDQLKYLITSSNTTANGALGTIQTKIAALTGWDG